ncbi:beta strand repeat-containing protein, partial [Salinimicrobium sp. TH3]|uniref:beta strand repeat-containing protein n=1 Tax=Salinimicrobium sp. TH3 TaxID=2997342 RepID=UPI002276DB45
IITDDTAPVADATSLADVTAQCEVTFLTAPTATDNCSAVTVSNNASLPINAQGTTVVTWTFEDAQGNTSSQTQNVVVTDTTAPDAVTLQTVTGNCEVTVTAPTTEDNCAGTITGTTPDPLVYTELGTYTITWTFDDGNGNATNVEQTVIVQNNTAPVAPVLADAVAECQITVPAPTTSNACSGETITGTTNDPLTYSEQGEYIITWTFDDGDGNVVTSNQNVFINDTTAPETITLADVTGECSANVTAPKSTDNCAGTITATTDAPLTYTEQGDYIVTWTFDDGNGNITRVDQNVIVKDITAPETVTLADVTGECSATVVAPTTSDNCAGTITATTDAPLTYSEQGEYVVTWTFNDGNGNITTVDQNVIVKDITAPEDITLADVTGECSATVTAPTTSDNCAGTITATTDAPLTYSEQGEYVVIWTFKDGNGNITTVDQNVIVKDITAPEAVTLQTVTGNCEVTVTAPTTEDNCAGTITGTTSDPLVYTDLGTYTITWTFDDGNGNATNVDQTVVVQNNTAPVAPVLADAVAECQITLPAPTTSNACTGETITGTTNDPLTYSEQGEYIITWTFDDGDGNVVTSNQNVIINDTTAPETITLADVTGECSATVTAPTSTDNCAGTITATTEDALTYTEQGEYVVTWMFDDGNGNITRVDQNVIVKDVTAPEAITLADVTGECSATVTAPTTSDNCAGTITATTDAPLTYNEQGEYVVTWTFNDGNGNITTVDQNVIVKDITAPETVTLADVTVECSATVTAPTTSDNCAGTITATTDALLTYSEQGEYVVIWTFNDGNGNITTVDQNVIVKDLTAPEAITIANVTGECSATVVAPTTSDNCAGTITATTDDALTYTEQGEYVVTWTFNDGNGNITTVDQNVIVNDTTAPDAVTLQTVTGNCEVTVTAPTTEDNCAGTITGTTSDPLVYTDLGTYTITWTFDDGNGNATNVDQTVVVQNNTAPVAPVLVDAVAECQITVPAPTTSNACTGETITGTTNDPLTYSEQGEYIITWTFDDGDGNVVTSNQNVIINDTTAPEAITLADVTGECSATVVAPTTTDNCAGTITATTEDALTYTEQGEYVVTWTFDDGNGNITRVDQNVIVKDVTAPEAITLADVTGECSATVVAPTTSDNCAGTITATTDAPLTYSEQGEYVVTWTFNDGNGNITTVDQNVIVKDITAPEAITLADVTGECSATVTAPTTSDNCAGTITATTDAPLTYTEQGEYVVTWTFNDGNGNITTVDQNVIVKDTTAPDAVTLQTVTGNCEVTVTAPTTEDNCAGTITGTTPDPLVYSELGTYTITWTFDDGNGNATNVDQTVVVQNNTAPVAPVLVDAVAECQITVPAPTTSNACTGETITGTTNDPLTYSEQGEYIITWTFDDGDGNVVTSNQNVIINDTTAPEAITLADVTGECSANVTAPTTSDNCAGTITATTDAPLTYTEQGDYIVTWTFNDGNGNITIVDQ